jgi:hypothetical protein
LVAEMNEDVEVGAGNAFMMGWGFLNVFVADLYLFALLRGNGFGATVDPYVNLWGKKQTL